MPDRRPGPAASVSKSLTRVRHRGAGEVGRLALHRLQEAVASEDVLVFFRQDVERVHPRPSEKTQGLEFRLGRPADGPAYARQIGTDSATTFAQRLSQSTRCYLIRDAERILHASWVTTAAAWTRELRRYVHAPARGAYVYESFTSSAARGRGIYPFALGCIAQSLRREGIEELWVAVEEDNPASQRSVTKAGFEEAFRIGYRRRLGRLVVDPPRGPLAAKAHEILGGRGLSA